MTETIELKTHGEAIRVELRRSLKARAIAIHIKLDKVELVLPHRTSERIGHKFLLSKEAWIRKKLRNRDECPPQYTIHDAYPMLDNLYSFKHVSSISKVAISIEDQAIIAYSPKEILFDVLTRFFKDRALDETSRLAQRLAKEHGFQYNKISVKDLTSKWGSCSSARHLLFNWRIIFAPEQVFHYLVTHELCHLKEMNHGDRFWKLVAGMAPTYKQSEYWLKRHGHTLHHYLPRQANAI